MVYKHDCRHSKQHFGGCACADDVEDATDSDTIGGPAGNEKSTASLHRSVAQMAGVEVSEIEAASSPLLPAPQSLEEEDESEDEDAYGQLGPTIVFEGGEHEHRQPDALGALMEAKFGTWHICRSCGHTSSLVVTHASGQSGRTRMTTYQYVEQIESISLPFALPYTQGSHSLACIISCFARSLAVPITGLHDSVLELFFRGRQDAWTATRGEAEAQQDGCRSYHRRCLQRAGVAYCFLTHMPW